MFQYNLTSTPTFNTSKDVIDNIFINIHNNVHIIQKWTINIIFLDADSIQKLNKDYRNIDKVTDVLSFHYFDNFDKLKKNDISWEIILNEDLIISQWKEYKLWTEKEFYKLLIHSIIHILWFDHILNNDYKKMQKIENKIWKEVFEK